MKNREPLILKEIEAVIFDLDGTSGRFYVDMACRGQGVFGKIPPDPAR